MSSDVMHLSGAITDVIEDALPASAAARARDYPHAKPGSELYIYNNWSMQWGLHPGNPPIEAH